MLALLSARGPDRVDILTEGPLTVGLARLTIVGEEGPDQPRRWDGIVSAVNGEIYNHADLRLRLPHHARPEDGASDCALLPALYRASGGSFIEDLDGIFSGVIYDAVSDELLLFRDHAGIKPLHWRRHDGGIAFGSATSALTRRRSPTLDRRAFRRYLATGYVEGPGTLLLDVHDVSPGTIGRFDPGSGAPHFSQWRRWRGRPPSSPAEVGRLIERAVHSETPSSGPVHSTLSGGLDSTLTTLLAARHRPDLTALTVAYADAPEDPDRLYAQRLARETGIAHEEVAVDWRDYRTCLLSDWEFDQPLGDPNALAFARLCARVRDRGGRMLLSGDGADELFCGYPYYRRARLAWPLARFAAATFSSMMDKTDRAFVRRLTSRPYPRPMRPPSGRPLRQMQILDLEGWLEANLLEKADRFGMASSVEVRVPFLRRQVIEAALGLPDEEKISGDPRGKVALRREFAHLIPPWIMSRPKQGFASPVERWLAGPLGVELAAEANHSVGESWDVRRERRLWREHLRGEANWGQQLWRLSVARAWWRTLNGAG